MADIDLSNDPSQWTPEQWQAWIEKQTSLYPSHYSSLPIDTKFEPIILNKNSRFPNDKILDVMDFDFPVQERRPHYLNVSPSETDELYIGLGQDPFGQTGSSFRNILIDKLYIPPDSTRRDSGYLILHSDLSALTDSTYFRLSIKPYEQALKVIEAYLGDHLPAEAAEIAFMARRDKDTSDRHLRALAGQRWDSLTRTAAQRTSAGYRRTIQDQILAYAPNTPAASDLAAIVLGYVNGRDACELQIYGELRRDEFTDKYADSVVPVAARTIDLLGK